MNNPGTRLIFIEGIVGSGKSTLTRFLARQASRNHILARGVVEHARPHPIHAYRSLPHWQQPWLDISINGLIEASLGKWRQFVGQMERGETVYYLDGGLFQGDFISLFLMDCSAQALLDYYQYVLETIHSLHSVAIVLDPEDLTGMLQQVCTQRGASWIHYQVNWRMLSPYFQSHKLAGLDGWVQMYANFRELTAQALGQSTIPRLSIETGAGDWNGFRQQSLDWLGLRCIPDTPVQTRLLPLFDRIRDIL